MKEAMTDTETLGTKAGSVILSIGAVMFDRNGQGHGDSFYCNINVESSLMAGLTYDPRTIEWWNSQPAETRQQLSVDTLPVEDGLREFANWYKARKPQKFWCQGLTFDAPILEAAMAKFDITPPWKFWETRDTRTAYDVYNFHDKSVKREGTYHNALANSIHQVDCLQKALKNVR